MIPHSPTYQWLVLFLNADDGHWLVSHPSSSCLSGAGDNWRHRVFLVSHAIMDRDDGLLVGETDRERVRKREGGKEGGREGGREGKGEGRGGEGEGERERVNSSSYSETCLKWSPSKVAKSISGHSSHVPIALFLHKSTCLKQPPAYSGQNWPQSDLYSQVSGSL